METILDRIHRSSIELLASIGVRFHCPETLERLAMMGVCVAGGLVRFTEAQVMDCLSMAPETFTLKSRNAEKDVRIGTRFFNDCPNMGAMVLECTGFPPFARALQREIGIPVFSWGTLMDFAYSISVHRDFYGHV